LIVQFKGANEAIKPQLQKLRIVYITVALINTDSQLLRLQKLKGISCLSICQYLNYTADLFSN